MTPRLAESPRGLSTQGNGARAARSSGLSVREARKNAGTRNPAAWKSWRERFLSRQARAAAGGWKGTPKRVAASAASSAGRSPTAATPSTLRPRRASSDSGMRSNFTAIARSFQGSSMMWHRSVASVTSTPRRRAASAKMRIWYPVVAAKRRRCLATALIVDLVLRAQRGAGGGNRDRVARQIRGLG